MKRICGEQIQSYVETYLKKRHFNDTDTRVEKDIQNLVVRESLSMESGVKQAVSLSSITGDASACEQQFNRFKTILKDAPEPYRTELAPLLYPMFLHIFLEMILNGHKTPAHKFYNRHHGLFTDDESLKASVLLLGEIYSQSDIEKHVEIRDIRQQRYTVEVSDSTMEYMKNHLTKDENILLLQILNNYIYLKSKISRLSPDIEPNPDPIDHTPPVTEEKMEEEKPRTDKDATSDVTMATLKTSIGDIQNLPQSADSICLYTIEHNKLGMCCSSFNSDNSLMAAGFEDSGLRVWTLTPKPLTRTPTDVHVEHVNLATDYIEHNEQQYDNSQVQTDMICMRGHSGPVYKTHFTSDSAYCLSCSEDASIRLWDLQTYTNKVLYKGHNSPVWDIELNLLDGQFVSGSSDKTARLWFVDRTYPIRSFIGHTLDVNCVKYHPNCNYVATGSADKTVRLWNVQDGRCARLMPGHRAGVFAMEFSPDGKCLATAGEDRRIKIWDLGSGGLLADLHGHTESVYSLCYNDSGSVLASGGMDGLIRIWDMKRATTNNNTQDGKEPSTELLGAYHTSGAYSTSGAYPTSSTYPNKSVTIHTLKYTARNVLMVVGSTT